MRRRRTVPRNPVVDEPALAWRRARDGPDAEGHPDGDLVNRIASGPTRSPQEPPQAGPPTSHRADGDPANEPALRWRRMADTFADPDRGGLGEEPALAWRGDLPTPDTARLYERWLSTSAPRKWGTAALAAVVSGPFAVLAALWQNSTTGFAFLIVVVVLGPIIEESVKGAGALWLAELRPWLVPTAVVLPIVTLLAGLVFAALENVWFLVILIDEPSAELVRWRWILGPSIHGTASLIVGFGAARMWRRGMARGRSDFADALPFLGAAALLHGAFNLSAVLLSVAGAGPDS